METPKCENGCLNNPEICFKINKYFKCPHYQCKRTTIILNYCIKCGNSEKILKENGEKVKLGKRRSAL